MPAGTKKLQDVYANRAFKTVVASAANVITFSQLQFGVGLFQGVAMILNRIEWSVPQATLLELVAIADTLTFAVTNRDDLTYLDATNQSVYASLNLNPIMVGAVVGIEQIKQPWISDFSGIQGGGLIIPANPIYIAVHTAGFAAAATARAVLYFTFKTLTDAEYIELLQTIMPSNI